MTIAFIDDGISDLVANKFANIEHYQVMADLDVKKVSKAADQSFSHGTVCAAIFHDIYPNNAARVIDVSVLDYSGRTTINRLVAALEWCLKNAVKLIHMSLGTVNYHDIAILQGIINALLDNGSIIVAAFHNMYLKSYPAAFPGVFGVRHSLKKNGLKNAQFALDYCEGLSPENCFVVCYEKTMCTGDGKKIRTSKSNSFAAPVLTGNIARYLNSNPNATVFDAFNYLKKNCSTIREHVPEIRTILHGININTEKPVIAFVTEDIDLFREMREQYTKLEYAVAALSDKDGDNTIPIAYYLGENGKISSDFLLTVEIAYKPDVILLCTHKRRLDFPVDWQIIDAFVRLDQQDYCLEVQEGTYRFSSFEELKEELTAYFQPADSYFSADKCYTMY